MRPLVKRIALAAIDGLIQAVAVGLAGLILTTVWLYLGRVQGVWRDRAIGAALAFGATFVFASAFVLFQRLLRIHLDRRKKAEASKRSSADKGFLDYRLDAEVGLREANEALLRIAKLQEGIRVTTEKRTRQIDSANRSGGEARKLHRICLQTASDLDRYSERMELERQSVDRYLNDASRGWDGILALRPAGPDDVPGLNALRHGIEKMLVSNRFARQSQKTHCDSVFKIKGISQALNGAADRHQQVIHSVIDTLAKNGEALKRVLQTIDQKLADPTTHA